MRRFWIAMGCVLLAACAAPMEDARVASAAGANRPAASVGEAA